MSPARVLLVLTVAAGCGKPAVVGVSLDYPGASAAAVDEAVVAPVVRQLAGVDGAARIEAAARAGTARVTLRFPAGTDPDAAARRVLDRVALALPLLPEAVRGRPPEVAKWDPDRLPAFWLAVGGEPAAATAAARGDRVRIGLGLLPGVTRVRDFGGRDAVLTVRPDPAKLAAAGLTAADLRAALRDAGLRAADPEAVAGVRVGAGRLGDVAAVARTERPDGLARLDAAPAVLVAVWHAGGPSAAAGVRKFVADRRADLPAGVTLDLVADLSGDDPAEHLLV